MQGHDWLDSESQVHREMDRVATPPPRRQPRPQNPLFPRGTTDPPRPHPSIENPIHSMIENPIHSTLALQHHKHRIGAELPEPSQAPTKQHELGLA